MRALGVEWHAALPGWLEAFWRASWQGAILIGFIWCVCRAIPALSPTIRCWLWRLALIKLMVLLVWTGTIDLALLPASEPAAPPEQSTPASATRLEAEASVTPPSRGTASATPPGSLPAGSTPVPPAPVSADRSRLLTALLFSTWTVGLLAILVLLICRMIVARRWRRTCVMVKEPSILDLCESLAAELRLAQPPLIMVGSACESPVVYGALRTCVVLPAALVNEGDIGRLRLILRHEMAHIRRCDLVWNWVSTAAWALFFFHPLVWLALRELRLSQELACDALAVGANRASVGTYGALLLEMAGLRRTPANLLVTVGVVESFEFLKRRLQAMKELNRSARWARAASTMMLLGCITALLPWRVVAQDPVDEPRPRAERRTRGNANTSAGYRVTVDRLRWVQGARVAVVPSGMPLTGMKTSESHESGEGFSSSTFTGGSGGGFGGSFTRPNLVIDLQVDGPQRDGIELMATLDGAAAGEDDLGRGVESAKNMGPFKLEVEGVKYPQGSGCVPIHLYVAKGKAERLESLSGALLVADAKVTRASFKGKSARAGAQQRVGDSRFRIESIAANEDGITIRAMVEEPEDERSQDPRERMARLMQGQGRLRLTLEDSEGVIHSPQGASSGGTTSGRGSSGGGTGAGFGGESGGSGGGVFHPGGPGGAGGGSGGGTFGTGAGGTSGGTRRSSSSWSHSSGSSSGASHEFQFPPLPDGVTIKAIHCQTTEIVGKPKRVPFEFTDLELPERD